MHFDVFVEQGTSPEVVLRYGKEWLKSIGENPAGLKQSRCHFCHTKVTNPEVQRLVNNEGVFILQMEAALRQYNQRLTGNRVMQPFEDCISWLHQTT